MVSANIINRDRNSTEDNNNCIEALWKDLCCCIFYLLLNLSYYSLFLSFPPFTYNIGNMPALWKLFFLFLIDTYTQFEEQTAQKVILGSI